MRKEVAAMNNATLNDPNIKRAKDKGTGLPNDGHTLTYGV